MGCNFGDLDNDAFLDFYLATGDPDFFSIVPNRIYRNVNGNSFEDGTYSGGFGHIQKGHAIGFRDLDMDGDQDIYAVMGPLKVEAPMGASQSHLLRSCNFYYYCCILFVVKIGKLRILK